MFEKSATELKLKQKLLKCKRTIQIVTFNVRNINRIGQIPELSASVIDHNIDICIEEHRYIRSKDIEYHDTGNGWALVTVSAWKSFVNTTIGGVSMLIGTRVLKSLNSIGKIQPNMMVATFDGKPCTTIIFCYSLTNVNEETDLIAFYNELSNLFRSIPKHVLVIGVDVNVQIVINVNHKFSLHNSSKRNGKHLTNVTLENGLTCINTKFQKRKRKRWTYTNAKNNNAQIDYVFINK